MTNGISQKEPEFHPNSLKSKNKIIKLHDDTLKKCVKLTDHFIESGIRRMKWDLTNSFTVTFTDRKRSRTTKHSKGVS